MRSMLRVSWMLAGLVCACVTGVARGADGDVKVTLIDAGQGSKSELRYMVEDDAYQTSKLSSTMVMTQSMSGMQLPAQILPEMITPMTVTIKERVDGDTRYEIESGEVEIVDDGSADPQMLAMMRQMMKGSGGVVTKGVMDARGLHRDMDVQLPGGANPGMEDQLKQSGESAQRMALPFPEEAIGIGAEWLIEEEVSMNGVKIKQSVTCTLKDRYSDMAVIELKIKQSADPQKINNPQMPQMTIDLKELAGEGKGEVRVFLKRVLPVKSTMEMQTTMKMSMEMAGQSQEIEQSLAMTVAMESEVVRPATTP